MKRFVTLAALSFMLLPHALRATDLYYTNNGTITDPPQIDAINFINNGTFDIFTTYPFDTSNTRNFTNNGTMIGSVGFRFDNAPASSGTRSLSANFHNRLTGVITATDQFGFLELINGQPTQSQLVEPSFLLVYATNIINEGTLTAGSGGILRLVGTNVNLSRSGIQIAPLAALGSQNGVFTNYFIPDVGIYDHYWGQTNQVMNSATVIQAGANVTVTSPRSGVVFAGGGAGFATVQLVNP